MITLDGFFEGINHDLSWHNVDDEFNIFAIEQLNNTDTLLFGRVTYELMAGYWPTENAKKNDPVVAAKMNTKAKIVFSKTLQNVDWNNTRLITKNIKNEILEIKQQEGKDIALFGSSALAVNLIDLNLIDEFRIMVNPIFIGEGKRLFNGLTDNIRMELIKVKIFRSGNVLLYYQPSRIE